MTKQTILRLSVCALLTVFAAAARADEPLPPPRAVTACSASNTFCAKSDPAKKRTDFVEISTGKVLWSIPGWHRWMFASDDGVSLVVGYDGMNLVPRDVGMDEPVLFFYRRGALVRKVALKELYSSKSAMDRTASHYAWAEMLGFDRENHFVVYLVGGRKRVFDPATGKPIAQPGKP